MKVRDATKLAELTADLNTQRFLFEHPSPTVRKWLVKNQYLHPEIIELICQSLNTQLRTKRGRLIPQTKILQILVLVKNLTKTQHTKEIAAIELAKYYSGPNYLHDYRCIKSILALYKNDIIPDDIINKLSGHLTKDHLKMIKNHHYLLSVNIKAKFGLLNIKHSLKEAYRAIHFSNDEQELLVLANDPRESVTEVMAFVKRTLPESVQLALLKNISPFTIIDIFTTNIENYCEHAQKIIIEKAFHNSKQYYSGCLSLDRVFVGEAAQLHIISTIESSVFNKETKTELFKQFLNNKSLSEKTELVINMMSIIEK